MAKLLEKIKKELPGVIKEYGYKSKKEFIEDALLHRVLELKKMEFLFQVKKIREAMKKKGVTEEEILEDFEKFSHQK